MTDTITITNGNNAQSLGEVADAAGKASTLLDAMNNSLLNSQTNLNGLNGVMEDAKNVFNTFKSNLVNFDVSLNVTRSLTEKQVTQFGLLSAAILGTKKSFDDFSSIDTSNLSTFTDQIKYMIDAFGDTESGLGQLVKFSQDAFGKLVPNEIINEGIDAVRSFVLNLARSSDNALRVQNAYIQLAAKTGNLTAVYAAAGPDLENINALLEKQTAIMSNAVKATGLAPDIIHRYYSELGTIPKGLESVVVSGGSASESISLLTATINTSMGTGRGFTEIVDDMREALKNYNITGEEALQFSARISEVSNKFGINVESVRESLRSTASTFRMFGNEAEASARILNNYVGALQSTGLSGQNAVEVVTSMTGAVSNLNIAQKAFLSAQTGGPGGLMGSFQIEKMLRDGKLDEVFDKVKNQMQKQFGKIVNLEEASNSPGAAAQMTRQMMLLRQGPMGQFAKSDQEAIRILEALRSRQEGKTITSDLSSRIVQETMDKGSLIQEKSYTELSRIRGILEGARYTADIANLGLTQQASTVSGGTVTQLTDNQRKSKTGLRNFREESFTGGGQINVDYINDINNGAAINDAGKRAVSAIKEFEKLFIDLASSLKSPLDALKQAIDIRRNNVSTTGSNTELQSVNEQISKANHNNITNSGNIASTNKTNNNINNQQNISQPTEITVHVNGFCLKCKQESEISQQASSINPAGTRF